MNPTQRGRLLVLGAAFFWSTSGALVKLSYPVMNGWQVAGIRALFACLFLAAIVKPWRARPFYPRGKVIPLSLIYAIMLILFILANTLTTAANAIFLQDTAPLWVLVLSPFLLKEPFRARDAGLLAVCGVGLALFFMDDLKPGQADGNILALFSGLGYGLVILGLRWGRHKEDEAAADPGTRPPSDSELILVWGNLICFLACLPLMNGLPSAAFEPATHVDFAQKIPSALQPLVTPFNAVAFMGVFQLGLGYLLLSRGVRHVPAIEASLLALIEPVLNPVWTYLVAGEKPGPFALAGGAIIIGSVAFQALRERANGSAKAPGRQDAKTPSKRRCKGSPW
ncbi:MAG TPA: DMT family transporter, partial [Planctomycetota bacterium]|nr:DMT family transporter [Planctomycetota bacterium]